MADETESKQPMTEQTAEPTQQESNPAKEPDYKALYEEAKANARKWEERSKANRDAASKWEQAQKEAQTVEERIAALEAENQKLTAERERRELVGRVASATGIDAAIVASLNGTDEDALTAQAQAIAAATSKTVHPDISDNGARGIATGMSKAEILAIKDPTKRLEAIKANIKLFE